MKKNRFTRRQYYHESHFLLNQKKREQWQKSLEETRTNFSFKTCRIDSFERSLNVVLANFEGLYVHYSKKKWGMEGMDNAIYKRKAVDRFFENMKGRSKPIIAYGDASFSASGRNEKAVPVKWIKRHCRKTFRRVFDVDERHTTANCHQCGTKLQDSRRIPVLSGGVYHRKRRAVRGLKWCRFPSLERLDVIWYTSRSLLLMSTMMLGKESHTSSNSTLY